MQWVHRQLWPILYLIWAVPFLAAIEAATPPWQNSDEPLHMARAVQIAHGGLIGYRAWTTSGGQSDRAIYDAYRPVEHVAMHPDQKPTQSELDRADQVRWSPTLQYTSFPNTAQYPPFFYLPAAAAYWLGRAAGSGIDSTLHIARLANAALFALITALALSIASRARFLLAAILMLPMTLSLACAASQDSLMIAAIALAVALLDRLANNQQTANRAQAALIAACLACTAMARPPYAGFLLLLLAFQRPLASAATKTSFPPLREREGPTAQRWRGEGPRPGMALRLWPIALNAAIVLAWCVLIAAHTSVKLGGSDIHQQLTYLHTNPGQIPSIAIATITRFAGDYWAQFIGTLGWTDTVLPFWYTLFATAVIVIAAVASTTGPGRRPSAAWAGIGFAIMAIFVLQYLTWTWPGQPYVTGVLGRYFIPPAMIAALGLPQLRRHHHQVRAAGVTALLALAIITPPVTLHALHQRYQIAAP